MKFSEKWLREWVNPDIDSARLVSQLTNAGLEVDSVTSLGGDINDVVVAKIVECGPHPGADRLQLCKVDAGDGELRSVVCGAPNARAGLVSAFAQIGATLPGGHKIKRSQIRGETSEGMLCSERELALSESHEGIMELGEDAPLGAELVGYLDLDDTVIEVDLTPNRGECLSINGIAREVGAINGVEVTAPAIRMVPAESEARFPVSLEAPVDCPRYVGRIVSGIDQSHSSPLWMQERLRRSGVRPISPVVDVTNYVMLELGQPMHAFDLNKLEGGVRVRRAQADESLELLDGRVVTMRETTLVIADEKRAVALAGIMGGTGSGVTDETVDVFLESAFFDPTNLAGQARHYALHTDASHRFERGVDPELQRKAMERATQLLTEIVGGTPGPIVDEVSAGHMPRRAPIKLRASRISRLIGMPVDPETVADVLKRLGMLVQENGDDWTVTPPSYRFDVTMEADLIEEVARLVGYNNVPTVSLTSNGPAMGRYGHYLEAEVSNDAMRSTLVSRDYQEAITYSFVDPELARRFNPDLEPIRLANPISSEMSDMRTSLWPGLFQALVHNVHRQQSRVRLFEMGLSFVRDAELAAELSDPHQVTDVVQRRKLAGAVIGPAVAEQWGVSTQPADFFDVKADIEAILSLTRDAEAFRFEPAPHPALHPGQSASVCLNGVCVGYVGRLHPAIERDFKMPEPVFLFELDIEQIHDGVLPAYRSVSKFPSVRRDISLIVDDAVSARQLDELVGQSKPDVLKNLQVFDVYRGEGIDLGKKSVSLALMFQDEARTLNDAEIDAAIEKIVAELTSGVGAILRG